MYTKKKYRSEVIELGSTYGVQVHNGNNIIDRAVQQSIDEVFRRLVPKRPYIWEKTVVLSDGDDFPDDYINFVDAYYTQNSLRTGFRYIPIPEWAGVKNNSAALAENSQPAWTEWDHAFHTYPIGLASVSFVYNSKPTQLYIPGAQPADDTLSDIPEDADGLVVRGAFERVIILMVDEKEALGIAQDSLERIQKANMEVYTEQLVRLVQGGEDATVR